jgi:glyoxylase-like metal-dependent hydrolase (beta-lactamase superfamily II)
MPGSAAARGVTPAPRREGPAAPPLKVEAERIADGVWFLNGGAPVSVLVEFRDHVVVIEAPQGDERTEATVAAVKALTPGKPIRYVVNTHHHFDHSGGVRAVVAEGITLLTHEKNKAYFERILKNPFVLAPDRLARSPRAPMIEGVGAKRVLTDGLMTLELHQLRGNLHDEAMLVGYLPRTRMLIQSDAFHPRPGAAPLPAPPPFSVNLLENIERLELDVAQLVQVHGGVEPFAQLLKAAGRQ